MSQTDNNEVLAVETNEMVIFRFDKQHKKIYNLTVEKSNCLFISGAFMIDQIHRV